MLNVSPRFRWVELQLATFYDPKSPYRHSRDVKSALNQLEKDIEVPELTLVYDQVYNMNTEPHREDRYFVMKAYKLIMCCRRPLKLSELTAAVQTDSRGKMDSEVDEEYLLNISRNLLVKDPNTSTMRFAHPSVREYLARRETAGKLEFSELAAHAQAFNTCLAFLSNSESFARPMASNTDDGCLVRWRRTFENYASVFWPAHYRLASQSVAEGGKVTKALHHFLLDPKQGPQFKGWTFFLARFTERDPPAEKNYGQDLSIVEKLRDCCAPATPFLVACVWGFLDVVLELLKLGVDPDARNRGGNSGLHLASRYGRTEILKALLLHGFDVDAKNESGQTALDLAVKTKSDHLVRLLLESGASLTLEDQEEFKVLHPHCDPAAKDGMHLVAEWLISRGASPQED
jgi:hypothetical protein